MRWLFHDLRYKFFALLVALMLWGVAHSTSSIERGFDIPVALTGVPSDLVVTGQTSDTVNIRVKGTRSSLRRLPVGDLEYAVDLSGAKRGVTEFEVDPTTLDLPRGTQVMSRSPSTIDFTLERRGTKAVKVRADLEGEPAEGYVVGDVAIDPPRVRITGARGEVLRLNEVLTETIDVTGAAESIERTVRASLRGQHIWLENGQEIRVRVEVQPRGAAEEDTGETGE